jgi:putative heme-binding domain-containing protein
MRSEEVQDALARRVPDPDPLVRLQVAYSLGFWDSPWSARSLGRLLSEDAADPWISAAALSSLRRENVGTVVAGVLASDREPPAQVMKSLLQSATGFGVPRAAAALLGRLVRPREGRYDPEAFAVLAGWVDALEQRGTPLLELMNRGDELLRADLSGLRPVFESARNAARDLGRPLSERVGAVSLLGRGPDHREDDRALLTDLLAPQTGEELQAAAVSGLGLLQDPEVPEALLRGWSRYTPGLRARVLETLLSRRGDGAQAVLDALHKRRIRPRDMPLLARQGLLQHPSAEVRTRARRVLTEPVDPDRDKVVSAYQAALRLGGRPSRGRAVFTRACANCHRLGSVGLAIGPDLAVVRDKPPDWFLPALFDPSRAVDARYLGYTVATRDGRILSGVLTEEAGDSLTIVGPSGDRQVVLRENLEELVGTGKSAMPEGLEEELTPQDVADLIALLRGQEPHEPEGPADQTR